MEQERMKYILPASILALALAILIFVFMPKYYLLYPSTSGMAQMGPFDTRASCERVRLQVNPADPIALRFESLDQMPPDETARAIYQSSFHARKSQLNSPASRTGNCNLANRD